MALPRGVSALKNSSMWKVLIVVGVVKNHCDMLHTAQTERTDMRSQVEKASSGKYVVRDLTNGKFVGYSYSSTPMYLGESDTFGEWGNYYSANGFCQKLERMVEE